MNVIVSMNYIDVLHSNALFEELLGKLLRLQNIEVLVPGSANNLVQFEVTSNKKILFVTSFTNYAHLIYFSGNSSPLETCSSRSLESSYS